jgi:hypothetical protein
MDPVVFMVRVPVAVIFGVIIVLTLFQGVGFARFTQPTRGIAMTATVIVLAAVMWVLYSAAAHEIVPGIASGAPTYGLELWLATAMLGVTFPVIVAFCEGFGFWPLSRARRADMASADATRALGTEASGETPTRGGVGR